MGHVCVYVCAFACVCVCVCENVCALKFLTKLELKDKLYKTKCTYNQLMYKLDIKHCLVLVGVNLAEVIQLGCFPCVGHSGGM